MTDYYKDFYEKPVEGDVVRKEENENMVSAYAEAIREKVMDDKEEEVSVAKPHRPKSKYHKHLAEYNTWIDVYDVLHLYGVTNPAIAHAIKKMLCAGTRGYKDFYQDIQEAIDSLERAKDFPPAPF